MTKKNDPVLVRDVPWSELVGEEIFHKIDNVEVRDVVVKRYLPDGQVIYGPKLTLAHIFARWTMIPAMDEVSDATERAMKKFTEDC